MYFVFFLAKDLIVSNFLSKLTLCVLKVCEVRVRKPSLSNLRMQQMSVTLKSTIITKSRRRGTSVMVPGRCRSILGRFAF